MLQELAGKADGVPLGEHAGQAAAPPSSQPETVAPRGEGGEGEGETQSQAGGAGADRAAFAVQKSATQQQGGARSPEYQRVLDRYISRLVSLKQVPAALTVWR